MWMVSSYLKTPPLKFVNFLSPTNMKPRMAFVQSMRSWMRENELTEINVLKFVKDGKTTRLIRGDKQTIFLSTKLKDLDNVSKMQIIEIGDEGNLCLCTEGVAGEVVGTIKAN